MDDPTTGDMVQEDPPDLALAQAPGRFARFYLAERRLQETLPQRSRHDPLGPPTRGLVTGGESPHSARVGNSATRRFVAP